MWVRKKQVERYLHKKTQYQLRRTSVEGHVPDPTQKIAQSNTKNNIWNGISKGKYKLSFHLWVGMWVRKKKLKDTYTTIHSQFKQ